MRSGTRTGTLASGFTKLARFSKYHLRLTKAGKSDLVHVRFTIVDLGALVWALVATIAQVTSRHWTLTNIIALSIGFNAISLLRIDSFRTGFLLLALLFVYDVWWVFGTEVMVQTFEASGRLLAYSHSGHRCKADRWPHQDSSAKELHRSEGLYDAWPGRHRLTWSVLLSAVLTVPV